MDPRRASSSIPANIPAHHRQAQHNSSSSNQPPAFFSNSNNRNNNYENDDGFQQVVRRGGGMTNNNNNRYGNSLVSSPLPKYLSFSHSLHFCCFVYLILSFHYDINTMIFLPSIYCSNFFLGGKSSEFSVGNFDAAPPAQLPESQFVVDPQHDELEETVDDFNDETFGAGPIGKYPLLHPLLFISIFFLLFFFSSSSSLNIDILYYLFYVLSYTFYINIV